jgi:hypothetical protein
MEQPIFIDNYQYYYSELLYMIQLQYKYLDNACRTAECPSPNDDDDKSDWPTWAVVVLSGV